MKPRGLRWGEGQAKHSAIAEVVIPGLAKSRISVTISKLSHDSCLGGTQRSMSIVPAQDHCYSGHLSEQCAIENRTKM